ncbi:hypothetical protein CPC08DRAFT_746971 [Agrocybe pediades]|nr:hypothetical protein CPC08DRAFT_746971 [Agrocybe pediades]
MVKVSTLFLAAVSLGVVSAAPLTELVQRDYLLAERDTVTTVAIRMMPGEFGGNGGGNPIVYVNGQGCGDGLVDGVVRLLNGLLDGGRGCGDRGGGILGLREDILT